MTGAWSVIKASVMNPRQWRGAWLLLPLCALLAPTLCSAQQSLEEQALEQQGLTGAPQTWSVTLGAGLASAPRYPGASSQRARLVPLISIAYDGRFFAGPFGVGMAAVRWNGFSAGPVIGYEGGRNENDDPRLAGLGDISASATAGAFAAYHWGPLSISATARQAISHTDNGLSGLVQMNFRHAFPLARTYLAVGPDLEFGNADFERTWFGVSPAQSSLSSLPVYEPRGGINAIGVHAGLTYRASRHILWRMFGTVRDLTGNAAQSPIIERRTQFLLGAGVAYHF
jgi:MipA family protein